MDLYSLQADKLLKQYERLLYKIMHKFHISKHNANYDDYLQELRIKLLEVFKTFDGNPFIEKDQPRFLSMATIALNWRMLDLLRKEGRIPVMTQIDELLESALVDNQTSRSNRNLIVETFLSEAKNELTNKEYSLMMLQIAQEMTIVQLAEIFDVSRQTIHKWRKNIQNKLWGSKNLLMN